VRNETLGRFSAVNRLVGWGAGAIAAATAGVLATAISYRAAFGAFAIVSAMLIISYIRVVTAKTNGSSGRSRDADVAS
jgi:membrane protein implicated in regulation of membrane protease activity